MSDGTSYSDTYDDTYGFPAGLALSSGGAGQPIPGPGSATAVGTALQPSIRPSPPLPQNLGAAALPVTIDATITLAAYGGIVTLPAYGAGVTPVTIDAAPQNGVIAGYGSGGYGNGYYGFAPLANYGATCTSLANAYGGTVGVTTYDATLVGWTMQQVALTLAENNDESVSVAITQNGTALNLTSATINMYLKTAQGTPDGSALLLSSAGGSPAITITNAAGGLCTVLIPRADLYPETYTFYRIDVVFGGLQNTCAYGAITWITL